MRRVQRVQSGRLAVQRTRRPVARIPGSQASIVNSVFTLDRVLSGHAGLAGMRVAAAYITFTGSMSILSACEGTPQSSDSSARRRRSALSFAREDDFNRNWMR